MYFGKYGSVYDLWVVEHRLFFTLRRSFLLLVLQDLTPAHYWSLLIGHFTSFCLTIITSIARIIKEKYWVCVLMVRPGPKAKAWF